jgi:uncharacterized protein (TIGR02757 family)
MSAVRGGHPHHRLLTGRTDDDTVIARRAGSDVRLRGQLDRLYAAYDEADAVADPVQIVRRYPQPEDREVVGFLAAALAFGRVASVMQSVERVCAALGREPADAIRRFDPGRDGSRFLSIVHRWTNGRDVIALLWIMRHMLSEGSIEQFFLAGYDETATDVGSALDRFSTRALSIDLGPAYGTTRPRIGVGYFFPCPGKGSACKRLNLFLRWMVRKDRVDFGIWRRVRPAQLVVPLDTHVVRVGRCLGLTRYRTAGWRMAADITARLREIDPDDPVKYDFSLCHLGMHGLCGFRRAQRDARCPLVGVCRPGARTPPGLPRPSGRR